MNVSFCLFLYTCLVWRAPCTGTFQNVKPEICNFPHIVTFSSEKCLKYNFNFVKRWQSCEDNCGEACCLSESTPGKPKNVSASVLLMKLSVEDLFFHFLSSPSAGEFLLSFSHSTLLNFLTVFNWIQFSRHFPFSHTVKASLIQKKKSVVEYNSSSGSPD